MNGKFFNDAQAKVYEAFETSKSKIRSILTSKKRVYLVCTALVIITIAGEFFLWEDQFNDYTSIGQDLSQLHQKSIDLIIQLNTFLLTLAAGLFALLGIINGSKAKNEFTIYMLVLGTTMISISFFFGYKSIYEILNQISQNQIAITPKSSEAIMYLSKEFYHFLAALGFSGLCYISNLGSQE